jgi:hypothetical protein
MTLPANPLRLSVVIPPGQPADVDYYSVLKRVILITNITKSRVLLDRILLRFQSDSEQASIVVTHICSVELAPNDSIEQTIAIVPTAQFLPNTNTFDVVVWFKVASKTGLGSLMSEAHQPEPLAYIVVSDPKTVLGRVFISFKEPEDLHLKNTMESIARRAGFTPWTAHRDSHVGGDPWESIEKAVRESAAVVFLWTKNTDFTEGVKREVALCRKYRVKEKPLFEKGIPVPEPYRDGKVRYEWFELETPTRTFAKVIQELRGETLGARTSL